MKVAAYFWGACLVFAATPLLVPLSWNAEEKETSLVFPGWPERFQHYSLQQIQMDEKTEAAFSNFPGRVASFQSAQDRWIIRWISQPSRLLHPAAHCFRASGYEVQTQKIWLDPYELRWGVFESGKNGENYKVYEQIREVRTDGKQAKIWTDVSAWYWDAMRGSTSPPWLAVTRIQPSSIHTTQISSEAGIDPAGRMN